MTYNRGNIKHPEWFTRQLYINFDTEEDKKEIDNM